MAPGQLYLQDQRLEELQAELAAWGEPAYRARQILQWWYTHRATTWGAMSNLPKTLRDRLAKRYALDASVLVRRQGSDDSTQKFLWRLTDGALIESVVVPASPALYGEPSDRQTLCLSTQVGCAYGCRFCASGLDGFKRHLRAGEIVEQWLAIERWHAARLGAQEAGSPACDQPPIEAAGEGPGRSTAARSPTTAGRWISNLVVMGMGEPLANYGNLLQAIRILNAPWGGAIGARKITVSTSGLVPEIRRLANEPLQLRLAISLHGATDEVRNQLMPINRKYPLRELVAAGEDYLATKGRMITLEYILIAGINDHLDQVGPLSALAARLHAKINLIPYNRVEGLTYDRPSEAAQEAFLLALERRGARATLRREKGHDIDAACGQLRLKAEPREPLSCPAE